MSNNDSVSHGKCPCLYHFVIFVVLGFLTVTHVDDVCLLFEAREKSLQMGLIEDCSQNLTVTKRRQ